VLTKVQFKIRPREFNESIPGAVLFIQDIIHEKEWKNIFIHFSNPPEEPRIILAKGGKLNFYPELKRATIELYDGTLHSYPLVNPEKYSVTSFKELEEEIKVETLFYSFSKKKRVREKDIKELFRGVKTIRHELAKLEEEKARQENTDPEDPKFNKVSRALRQKKKDYISHRFLVF